MEEIINLENRHKDDIDRLLVVWESSVRATHTFLEEKDIISLMPEVEKALYNTPHLFCYKKNNDIEAFIGICDRKIEMLFVSSDMRERGIGKKLVNHASCIFNIEYVDVNEQNPGAVGFYEHLGFKTFERSPYDDQGNSFPILHMKKQNI